MIKSYLINLEKDVDRLAFFKANFDKLGIKFERITGVDGRLSSEYEYQEFLRLRPRNNKDWSRGQMGCFLSHYSAWKIIAAGDANFSAVFEDDIHIVDDIKVVLGDESWLSESMDIIRLETSTNRVRLTSQPLVTYANRSAYGVKSSSWCTGGYIISRNAAQALVELPTRFHDTSDVILFNFADSAIASKFKILQFNPGLCTQDKHLAHGVGMFSSNIETPISALEQFRSNLKLFSPMVIGRAAYRSLLGYQRIGFK